MVITLRLKCAAAILALDMAKLAKAILAAQAFQEQAGNGKPADSGELNSTNSPAGMPGSTPPVNSGDDRNRTAMNAS